MGVAWKDLLAVPFKELDCWGLARLFNARRGVALPDLSQTYPPTPLDSSTAVGALVEVRDGSDPQVGDILLSDPTELGYASHVAVVVEPGWALTSSRKHGPQCLPLHRTQRELGVWRASKECVSSGAKSGCAQRTDGDIQTFTTPGPSSSRSGYSENETPD